MKAITTIVTAIGAATFGLTAVPAAAQNAADPAATTTPYPTQSDNDDDHGKWGLLGLLGLAGLFGLKRRDHDHDRDRRTTGGGSGTGTRP